MVLFPHNVLTNKREATMTQPQTIETPEQQQARLKAFYAAVAVQREADLNIWAPNGDYGPEVVADDYESDVAFDYHTGQAGASFYR